MTGGLLHIWMWRTGFSAPIDVAPALFLTASVTTWSCIFALAWGALFKNFGSHYLPHFSIYWCVQTESEVNFSPKVTCTKRSTQNFVRHKQPQYLCINGIFVFSSASEWTLHSPGAAFSVPLSCYPLFSARSWSTFLLSSVINKNKDQ